MKLSKTLKITFTIIWTFFALWLTIPVDDGREVGDIWMEGGDLLVKTGASEYTWFDNIGFFALLMIPVFGMWAWSLFKNESRDKTKKRRSRML